MGFHFSIDSKNSTLSRISYSGINRFRLVQEQFRDSCMESHGLLVQHMSDVKESKIKSLINLMGRFPKKSRGSLE